MNFITTKIENDGIYLNEQFIELTEQQKKLVGERSSIIVGIRPEKMEQSNFNIELNINVDIAEMLGSEKIIYFNINNKKCAAKIDAQKIVETTTTLKINTNDFLFFDAETKERIR